ncbi:MAG TPA: protein kinase [Pyrinomonadaceae bacterium]|nr:protein kinase [Pyrinomonadaceae bacterium]
MTLTTGTRLGRYEIRSKLGEGGMGEVYLALDTELNRTIAVKIIPVGLAANEQRLRRFIQEAQAASALNHPHILTIHEIGSTSGTRFIATEFIDGDTVRQRINSGTLNLSEILEIAIQTASALAAAHTAGIIHRDIKPENIMVRRDGYVKVLDFGLAKLAEPAGFIRDAEAPTRAMVNTGAGMVMGTANYMSPEQAKGIDVDSRTDLWSLGVVLYEMIVGKGPFVGDTPTDSLSLVLQKEPVPLTHYVSDMPAELERIVTKALTKDREERYQTAKDLLIDLRTLKRKLEFDAQIDRTAPPESGSSIRTASGTRATLTSPTVEPHASSAEYIVSGIKQHKMAVAMGALVLVVAIVGIGLYVNARNSEVAIESIAVLPFQNRTVDPDAEYLSDGLAESLIYRLSQLPNLKVSPTSSVLAYKNQEIDPIKIGSELGVSAVLSGRIVQRGENLTISAELVDVRHNKLLWGEQYERKASELLQTQREMAKEIVDKLQLRVSGRETALTKHYTESNEAYQLYMKGRFYWNKRTAPALHKSVEFYEQAIQRDPSFALAYAGLADTYALLGGPEAGGDMRPSESLPKAKAAALKAIQIDESLAEPHVSLAHVRYFYDRDWVSAEREFKRAIELNPNYPIAHHWYAIFLSTLPGRLSEALAEIRRALELDPTSLIINAWYGRILGVSGQLDQAVDQLKKTVELDPNFILAHYRLGQAYVEKGMYNEAIDEFKRALNLPDGRTTGLMGLAYAYAVAGRKQEAQKALDELLELSKNQYVSTGQIAIIYIARGEKDKAFELLEMANRDYDLNLMRMKVERRFDPIRSDPRFEGLAKRIGLP